MPPEVPFVITPWAAGEHVRSSVYYLLVIVAVGLACAVPIEISKYAAAMRLSRPVVFVALTLQQVVLLLDVLRSYAWDWWLFVLSMAHLRPIDRASWMERHFTTVGPWPWPSGIFALLVIGVVVLDRMKLRVSPSFEPHPHAGS
jgi:hypothetical protein